MTPLPVRQPLSFVFSGRLVPEKKPLLLVEAFARMAEQLEDTRLVMIGSGPEAAKLHEAASGLGVTDRIDFPGSVTELSRLRSYYEHAIASVSPGCTGLSIVQSLGFGIPIIISDLEPHGPEIEAAVQGFTADFFEADSDASLGETLLKFYRSRDSWLARRDEFSAWCRARYSVEQSADRFASAIRVALDANRPLSRDGSRAA